MNALIINAVPCVQRHGEIVKIVLPEISRGNTGRMKRGRKDGKTEFIWRNHLCKRTSNSPLPVGLSMVVSRWSTIWLEHLFFIRRQGTRISWQGYL